MRNEALTMKKKIIAMLSAVGVFCVFWIASAWGAILTDQEKLGKFLFFDTNLSDPPGQSCAVCHAPDVGWTGPSSAINAAGAVYEGAVSGRFGNRKPPTSAYAGDSPILYYDGAIWIGGMFWDGRATGWTLGDPLAEQALGPFLNPLEQNNASPQVVVDKVLASPYRELFLSVCPAPDVSGQ
jgi:cytochrome c peroxidase